MGNLNCCAAGPGQRLGGKYDIGVSARAACSRLVGAAFLAGALAAVSVSSTSSWAQSSPEQEGVKKPISKKPSRKTAASPAATTESPKGEGESSAGTAAQSPLANCKQQYAAKKAASATEANGQASYLKACLAADPPPPGGAGLVRGGQLRPLQSEKRVCDAKSLFKGLVSDFPPALP